MGHIVRMQSMDQFIRAIRVLNELPGTWHSRGAGENPELLVLQTHFDKLVEAGVIQRNGAEEQSRGQEKRAKKSNP